MNRNWSILRRKGFSDDKFHTSKIGHKAVHPFCRIIRHFNEKHLNLNFFFISKICFFCFSFLCVPSHPSMCSFPVLLKLHLGQAVLTLCQHRHLICQIQKLISLEATSGKRSVAGSVSEDNTAEQKATCGQGGHGAEQNDPILATAAFTHPVIPYHSRFCYLCMVTG